MLTPLYTASATAQGARNGQVRSSDGTLSLKLTVPKQMGGPGGEGSNPEQLFAAGYAACFEGALRLAASQKKIELKEASITAEVMLGKTEAGAFQLAVVLRGHLPGLPTKEAEMLMQAAHEICPYSRATRGNIEVKLMTESK